MMCVKFSESSRSTEKEPHALGGGRNAVVVLPEVRGGADAQVDFETLARADVVELELDLVDVGGEPVAVVLAPAGKRAKP
jgi:hypothetical protein